MLIGGLSKKSGFSKDTIRFYEKNGLIELEDESRMENNYKNYSDTILRRLEVIRKIKEYGFTLVEIKAMIGLYEAGLLEQDRGRAYIKRKVQKIDEKIHELQRIKEVLTQISETPGKECELRDILDELKD